MTQELQPESASDKYLALNALRENIFMNHPSAYSVLDNAEFLPGSAGRAIGTALQDVAPSLGLIPHTPEDREQQIQAAIQRIKATRGHKNVGREMLRGAGTMAASSVIPTVLFSALLGKHGPIKAPAIFGKTVGKIPRFIRNRLSNLRLNEEVPHSEAINNFLARQDRRRPGFISTNTGYAGPGGARVAPNPTTPISARDFLPSFNFKNLTRKGGLHGAIGQLSDDIGQNAVGMGLMGAAQPLIADRKQFTDEQLDQAADVLRTNPYLTSLPAGDIIAASNIGKPQSKLHNALTGATIGAISTPIGMLAGHTLRAPFDYGRNYLRGKASKPLSQYFAKFRNPGHYIAPTALVAGLGALGGYLQPTEAPSDQQY